MWRTERGCRPRWRWLAGALLAAAQVATAEPLDAYTAQYGFSRYGITGGQATQHLSYPDALSYRLEVSLRPTGVVTLFTRESIDEVSTGTLAEDGALIPQRYTHARRGGRDRQRDFRFDRAAGRLREVTGSIPEQALPEGLSDDLVQLETLRMALRDGARTLDVPVLYAGKGRIERYSYAVGGPGPRVDTPAGEFDTVRVTRTDARGRYRLELWCAPALDFLPVRMERYRKDKFEAAMDLTAYTRLDEPAAPLPDHAGDPPADQPAPASRPDAGP